MSHKWTIKKLNYFHGWRLGYPWHVIPPGTVIPPRYISLPELDALYQEDEVAIARTHAEALAKVTKKIREAADA